MEIRWRILLPVGHLVVDCVVLALWLWHGNTLYQPTADSLRHRIQPILFLHEGVSFTVELQWSPPDDLIFLASGDLPAMLISDALRPKAYIVTRSKLWDRSWFLIHEALSFSLWFTV